MIIRYRPKSYRVFKPRHTCMDCPACWKTGWNFLCNFRPKGSPNPRIDELEIVDVLGTCDEAKRLKEEEKK